MSGTVANGACIKELETTKQKQKKEENVSGKLVK
jgi:hypothetical protein